MYLKRTPTKGGRVSLSAVQGYRDESGRNRQRTIRTFGYVDELAREFDDPVAHFRGVVAEMDAERLREEAPATITVHPRERVDKRKSRALRRHAGDALACWWLDALGVETAIRNSMRGRKVGFDLNAALRLLVCERLLDPGSKLAAVSNADRHFFRSELSEADAYRALTELERVSDRVVGACNRAIARNTGRDESLVYYDVTNYFFECDPDDGEEGLRRKGVSKEHRPNPIVQMGLLQDADGVPISFDLFPGNTNDCQTMLPVLEGRRERGMGRVVVVADRGMNSSANMAGVVAQGDGFVFSQSMRGTRSDARLRDWALSGRGYVSSPDGEFRTKGSQRHRRVHLGDVDTLDGEARDVDVEVKVVAMWSRKYAERARHEREAVLERSRQLVGRPGAYTRATHHGAAQYVRGVSFDARTGEVVEVPGVRPEIDREAGDRAAALDGHYLVVTSETDWEDSRILDAYRELWRIEESFRVTKTGGLSSRPVYVWTREHIRAHFLTCYLALLIVRLSQRALPSHPSAQALLDDMRALDCSYADDGWWLFDHRTDLTDEIFALVGEEAPRRWMRARDIKALFAKGKTIGWG
ncbi:IS1634 family transposase [Olsenella profusa]|uniref:Transposase, IS4 family n=1 Tax=Olsenella profusa F0195 TaxID=1125712 RepID=U2TTY2_9ACTN|nr:IS1634 family transposase [Olsenella profusa]ERL09538.1 transposase, IS4 family [Olsenella profusa F0195]